ncbi:MAG: serine/threonine protein kinase [Planctomycetota bacterium]
MTIQLSAKSFLQMVAQSGLLTKRQRDTVIRHVQADAGMTASQICDWLIDQKLITRWQGDKLLEARYRGFFLGPYRLLDRIARGGMSTIYSAQHRTSEEIHALKVLPPARTNRASYLPRFRREAEMTQRLMHPNIVRVFGVHEASDGQNPVHFMAMELLQGQDLFEIVNQRGPLSIFDAVEFTRQAALGLQCAHEHGLVHRDIKPGNLFLTTDRVIRILDLGLAQDFDSDENLTRDFNDKVLGTADYLAPEQAADSHNVDTRADLYSLGCTLYFLLSGRPPYTEGTLVQRLVAHQTRSPSPLSSFRSDIPESLLDLLRRMMARNKNDRVNSAALIAEELSRIQSELDAANGIRSPEVLKPESHLQHHIETETGSDDDSWPQQFLHAIASRLESSHSESVAADNSKCCETEIRPNRSMIMPDQSVGHDLASHSNPADLMFKHYLAEIEARCTGDSVWKSRPDVGELVRIVRKLRSANIKGRVTSGEQVQHANVMPAGGLSWNAVFLVLSAILAIAAFTASQL